jgi:tungstate transport system permease protein
MANIVNSTHLALGLLFARDPALLDIVALSLTVSLSASVTAAAIGLPLGAALVVFEFPSRSLLILIANALLGLPPVAVGLALYLLLSRSGPLGSMGILFRPAAMVVAQFLLALPIVVALGHRTMTGIWQEYGDQLLVDGARRLQAIDCIALKIAEVSRDIVRTHYRPEILRTADWLNARFLVEAQVVKG